MLCLSEHQLCIEAHRWAGSPACIWKIEWLRRWFQKRAAGNRDLGVDCWITVSICVCSEHEERVKYFKNVPFSNVALVMTAMGDSTPTSEEEVGV